MNRLIMLVLAAICCSIGCSRSPQPAAGSSGNKSAQVTAAPKGDGETENVKPSNRGRDREKTQDPTLESVPNETPERLADLHNVLEALFLHQFKNNASAAQQEAKAYFLTIKDIDPAPDFLKRFAGHTPPVKNGSEFAIGKGLEFRIDTWKWLSDDKIRLTGGYYENGLSSSGNRYLVVRKEDRWVVDEDEREWIS